MKNLVNYFSWNYFSKLNHNENIFYSPLGIVTALSIIANGASGNTQSNILQALRVNNIEGLNMAFENFLRDIRINYRDGKKFFPSNLITIAQDFVTAPLNAEFKNIVEGVYNSDIRSADFKNNLEIVRPKISEWIDEKTEHFITNYNSQVTIDTLMNLLTVVYFKGDWDKPFIANDTHEENFHNVDKSKCKVEMMSKKFSDLRYFTDKNYKAVELPYKKNFGQTIVAMYLIISEKEFTLDSWINESIDYKENFLRSLMSADFKEVKLKMPKFNLDIENRIKEILIAMGIDKIFNEDANFSNMIYNLHLKIDEINHRAKIKIDETGTEAAAVTESIMLLAMPPQFSDVKEFYIDRPFAFVIRDINSGVDLFVGVVNNLSKGDRSGNIIKSWIEKFF